MKDDALTPGDIAASVVPPRQGTGTLAVVVVTKGKVRHGVESHSVVLHAEDGKRYQLGGAFSRLAGRSVLVKGHLRHDMSSTAQEGLILRVESVETIDDGTPFSMP